MFLNPKPKEQSNIIRAIPTPPPLTATERDNPVRQLLDDGWSFLRRNKAYPLGGMLVALLAAAAVELAVTPHYRATIQILIGPTDLKLVEKSVVPAAQTPDANVMQVETETRVLVSDRVLRRVVRREHLTADPEFQHGGLQLGGFVDALRATVGAQADQRAVADP
jgi:polysaccharide biosynthesis transport protein